MGLFSLTKLTAEDFGGVQLPPEDIASLGNKKICDPDKLKVFTRLRARAFTMLDRCGVRFLSGWAIPEDKADEIIKVAPADTIDEQAAQDFGLNSEIENLGNTLFREISKDASDIWKNVFEGKTSVSQKALSPLRTMQTKLEGLSFVEPHVIPVHALIETALSKMPGRELSPVRLCSCFRAW